MREKKFRGGWVAGWGDGLTGPTTASCSGPCVDRDRDYSVVSKGTETIAIIPEQQIDNEQHQAISHLIAAAPDLLYVIEQIVFALPVKRDWLDPDLERLAQESIAKAYGETE